MEKVIVGLDLGPNSIGWAMVAATVGGDGCLTEHEIKDAGCRIIPMDVGVLSNFEAGNTVSQTAMRTALRSMRTMHERSVLRRERLHRVLDKLGFLPPHYAEGLTRYGKFVDPDGRQLAWTRAKDGKSLFLFSPSFDEMLADFAHHQPEWVAEGKKIPYDWTIYYLRRKALTQKITKEELAWVILHFNQKRGYYQARGEEQEPAARKQVEYMRLKVVGVKDSGDRRGQQVWYDVQLENGMVYRRLSNVPLDWTGQTKEFIVTTDLEKDGRPKKDKDGHVKRTFRTPTEQDWSLVKARTEAEIERSCLTVGAYIYETLLTQPRQKVRGKLVQHIERKYYVQELRQILAKQKEFHAELQSRELYEACIHELYSSNEAHRREIMSRDFTYLLVDDIIFYQRPLKSKKSLIADCPYECRRYLDKATKKERYAPVKCVPKSHPLYEEFRLWQFVGNLRIYEKTRWENGKLVVDADVTNALLPTPEAYVQLFDWLKEKATIDQKALLGYAPFHLKAKGNFRWNYVEDKAYPCCGTHTNILSRWEKAGFEPRMLSAEVETSLWHVLYSVEDKGELERALGSFARKHALDEPTFVAAFLKFPPFEKSYGAYSLKAIKKLLSLMRMGKYWSEQAIDAATLARIRKLIDGEDDECICQRVREKTAGLTEVSHFSGLPLWLACYVVYRHSEADALCRWRRPEEVDIYLQHFKQHSLRNPVVEQVLMETLRVVRDLWKRYGRIDEIHIELAREMKSTKEQRAKRAQQMRDNENANLRIRTLLMEFTNPEFAVENVRPYSPNHQDLLRIYEDGVFSSGADTTEVDGILKKFNQSDASKRPTRSEILKYKLWLDQKYRSPYTGRVIPLGKLFTRAYEIEHVIPQSRYFDDSFSNKVICESEVNKLKSNMLGYEFIKEHHGQIVPLASGQRVSIFSVEEYEKFVLDNYANQPAKKKKLLLEEIPDDFNQRQLNDTRYIGKRILGVLSNIVREEGELEATSKNVITCTGSVTARLKKDWGINDVWNRMMLPRFERLNALLSVRQFTYRNANGEVVPCVPQQWQKGFSKKRIDHRHHAMDAVVIACASRNMVNYLSNVAAHDRTTLKDLQTLLCQKCRTDDRGNYQWVIKKPWPTLTTDVMQVLTQIIVSFKQNLRVINRSTNYYQQYGVDGKKHWVKQEKGDQWAIRKSMHKATYFGEVNLQKVKTVSLKAALERPDRIVDRDLRQQLTALLQSGCHLKQIKQYFQERQDTWQDINLSKIEVYYFTKETNQRYFASRQAVDSSFNAHKIRFKVTDSGIRQIMLRHLERKGNDPAIAFSAEGLDEMNRDMQMLTGGKFHQPIYKVRVYESATKFAVGQKGNKSRKFVEADKGTNLFFAIYETTDAEGHRRRTFAAIPLSRAISRLKKGLPVGEENADGIPPAYILSPNSLLYVPTAEELKSGIINCPLERSRIYKVVSFTRGVLLCVMSSVAAPIASGIEFFSMNKMERALTGEMIKEVCIPIKVDRLGRIVSIEESGPGAPCGKEES